MEARLALSYLDEAGIKAELIGQTLSTLAPHFAAPGGAGTVTVLVWEEDLEKAKSILEGTGNP